MKLAYTILEVDRHENANSIRDKVSFMEELKVRICDARKEYPKCIEDYPKFKHIFDSITNIGFIGLWISNLNSFYSLINSDYDALLIFEDDAVLVEDFENKFKLCLKELPQQFGMFSVGYRDLYKSHYSEIHDIGKNNVCRMFQSGDSWGILYRKEFVIDLLNTITKYKILGGLPDTAIMSFVLGNLGFKSQYQAYSTTPVLGSLIIHDNDPKNSIIAKSPNTSDYLK